MKQPPTSWSLRTISIIIILIFIFLIDIEHLHQILRLGRNRAALFRSMVSQAKIIILIKHLNKLEPLKKNIFHLFNLNQFMFKENIWLKGRIWSCVFLRIFTYTDNWLFLGYSSLNSNIFKYLNLTMILVISNKLWHANNKIQNSLNTYWMI